MMLTIHGLPIATKYHDLKVLVKRECNLSDFILDNLISDGDGTKRVRIGVTDEREGNHLMKCLDGYRMSGNLLHVVPMGKGPPMNASQPNFEQRSGFPPRDNYASGPGPGPEYNSGSRPDPWGSSNEWGPNQTMPNQPMQNFNYQQPGPGMQQPYRQQHPQGPKPQFDQSEHYPPGRMPAQDQRYGFPPKNNIPDQGPQRRIEPRSHVLRSVEIIDEPLSRTINPPGRFPNQNYEMQQKPITIMKDNFQGPAQFVERQSNHGPGHPVYQGQGHQQPSWGQQMPPEKSQPFPKPGSQPFPKPGSAPFQKPGSGPYDKPYEKKYPEPDKRGIPGPRFSPRRDIPKDSDRRYSPRREVMKDSPRFSPRRDVPKEGARFSPRREHPRELPRFSPKRDISKVPRFSPHRDGPKEGHMPRFSPRRDIPKEGHIRFSPRRDIPKGNVPRFSPRRDIPKEGHVPRFSPRRDIPKDGPGPRFSPRRDMPMTSHGRRESPHGRRVSPSGRRMSPIDRRMSHRDSPGPKRPSPGRRESPSRQRELRYSPTRRHQDKQGDKYGAADLRSALKDVRPAYEPTQASNQAMYSGGYRPNIHENVQYPLPGRQQEQRSASWQQDRDKPTFSGFMKKDEDRRETARMKFEPRPDHQRAVESISDSKRSPGRKSRSPGRRDRSPLRDRYKKHSPSPRSPRRSWALEKRRSPDVTEAPPPPVWPGQTREDRDDYRTRTGFPERVGDDKGKRPLIWEHQAFDEKNDRRERRPEMEERRFPEENARRIHTEIGPRSQPTRVDRSPPIHNFNPAETGRFPQREPKFEHREDYPERRGDFRRSDDDRKPYDRSDFREVRRQDDRDDDHRQDAVYDRHSDRRDEFPRKEERKDIIKGHQEFNKEIEDVYKRAVELNKRAQELRRSHDRSEEYSDNRRRDGDRQSSKEFDRHSYQREDEPRHRDRDESRHSTHHSDERHLEEPPRRHHEDERRDHESNWKMDDQRKSAMSPGVKTKRDKASEDIATRILHEHGANLSSDIKKRVLEELKLSIGKILYNMYGVQDISFIEMVIKFNAKHTNHDKLRIFNDVISGFPTQYRNSKRPAEEHINEVPSKSARRATPDDNINRGYRRVPAPTRRRMNRSESEKKLLRTAQMIAKQEQKIKMSEQKIAKAVLASTKSIKAPSKPLLKAEEKPKIDEKDPFIDESQRVPPSVEPTPDGHYELNPLMTRLLEDELQSIMVKVWQGLPDTPPTEAEKLVTNKFKSTAGEHFKNVLGLNVTKRLLNIHNSLFVKLKFSRKPDRSHLKALMKSFDCCAVKRVGGNDYLYAAQMRNVREFDRICDAGDIRCGDARVTVMPCYKFTHCPSTLKTIYSEIPSDTKDVDKEKNIDKKDDVETEKKPADDNPTDYKPTETVQPKKPENKANVVTNPPTKPEVGNKVEKEKSMAIESQKSVDDAINVSQKKVDVTKESQKNEERGTNEQQKIMENASNVPQKKMESTIEPKKILENTNKTENDAKKKLDSQNEPKLHKNIEENPAKSKVTPASPQPKATPQSKATPQLKTSPQPKSILQPKASTQVKDIQQPKASPQAKTTPQPKASPQIKTIPQSKPSPQVKSVPQPKASPQAKGDPGLKKIDQAVVKKNKTVNDATTTKSIATPVKTSNKKFTEINLVPTKKKFDANLGKNEKISTLISGDDADFNDNDELDDEDILALMSEAIILDECSGSEED